jgi:ATP-dependent DNA helicase PIF1
VTKPEDHKSGTIVAAGTDQKHATLPEPPPLTDPPLSPRQTLILDRILSGQSFFFTGSAGTGKSVLLRAIIKAFRDKSAKHQAEMDKRQEVRVQAYLEWGRPTDSWEDDGGRRWRLAITASTGMAGVYASSGSWS